MLKRDVKVMVTTNTDVWSTSTDVSEEPHTHFFREEEWAEMWKPVMQKIKRKRPG